jgi:hypothetical protein
MARLAEAQLKTEQRFQDTDGLIARLALEAEAREKRLDERIEKLVSAIGEWIRKTSNGAKES